MRHENKLRHRLWHTRVRAAWILADVAWGKWPPKFEKNLKIGKKNWEKI